VRGVTVTPDHFLIDGGGGGAIATIAQTFLNPGDAVIAERPGYMGVMDSFVEQHAELAGVPLDEDGMKLDVLEATIDALDAAGHTPKLLYLQSLFHNPRGQCYTRDRMLGLIEICARKKILILNDEACTSTHNYSLAEYGRCEPSTFLPPLLPSLLLPLCGPPGIAS
jgi:2-aminoadipate transaminase